MHVFVLGFNHKSSPIELREKLYIAEHYLDSSLKHVLAIKNISESVILSTCNRSEIYVSFERTGKNEKAVTASDVLPIKKSLLNFISTIKKLNLRVLEKNCYYYFCEAAVIHLFRVTASLDSLVVGERQILGQVRDSYQKANELGATSTFLNKLFQSAIALGKRARSETKIGIGAVSVSLAAVELCGELYEDLSEHKFVIFGAGQMADLAALHLKSKKANKITFINRTLSRAKKLAKKYNGQAFAYTLENKKKFLEDSDIIFSATSAPDYIIVKKEIQVLLKQQKRKQMLLIDLAIPRNIDPAINDFDNVFLYCVDDLKNVVEKNRQRRTAEIKNVERIITEEVNNYNNWYSKVNILPVISKIRESFEKIRTESVNQFALKEKKIGKKIENMDLIEKISAKITSKIIKELMTGVEKCQTTRDWRDYSQKLMDVFGIEK